MSLVKTIGSGPDVTEICTNSTQSIITLIVCKIRTERNMSAECRLLYQYGKGFEHQCDSRFKLIQENQTVFLQLDGLTSVDSGNYSCECSTPDGTIFQHLNVTVEGKHTFIYPHSYIPLCWHCIVNTAVRWLRPTRVCFLNFEFQIPVSIMGVCDMDSLFKMFQGIQTPAVRHKCHF